MMQHLINLPPRYRDGFPVLRGKLPVVGHLGYFYIDGLGMLRAAEQRLGNIFWIDLAFGMWTLVYLGPGSFDLLKNKVTSSAHFDAFFSLFAGRSAISQDGVSHQHMRSAMNPTFSPHGLTQGGIGAIMAETVSRRIEGFASNKPIAALEEMQELTIDIIFRAIGIKDHDLPIWRKQYREFILSTYAIPIMLPGFPQYRGAKARKWIDAQFRAMIAAARGGSKERSLLSGLAHAHDDAGKALSDDEVIDNLRLIAFAGHETTASALAWLLFTLASRPDLWSALCDEVKKAPEARIPTSQKEAKSFPFADALFREIVRVYSPILLISRQATQDMTLDHHRIPKGTLVSMSPAYISRDPALFPDPDRFDPSRWIGRSSPPGAVEIAQFGGGPHFCLGYTMACLEGVQLAVGLALEMMRRGLAPRIADGPSPRMIYVPLGHPSPKSKVIFA